MPKVNLNRRQPDKLIVLIKGTAEALGIETPELARLSGVAKDRLYRRLKNPDELTRGEIRQLCRALGIPVEEARAVVI